MMVGQDDTVDGVLACLRVVMCFWKGFPAGKRCWSCWVKRSISISTDQFTPDMMPADIQTNVLSEKKVVHNVPTGASGRKSGSGRRDQSSDTTYSGSPSGVDAGEADFSWETDHQTRRPFCVMAQNPVEQEGTYPLPEAQLDRFLFKLVVGYPAEEDYRTILQRTIQ